jgi:hypothetical protein
LKLTLLDRLTHVISQREYTDEGFLKVPARIARTGIQKYLAKELQLDGDPSRLVSVYRPPEEVFNPESLDSYNAVDLTDDHPDRLIDPASFSKVVRGTIASPGVQDGDFVRAEIIIKDKDAIAKAEAGKVQLSAGYTAEYDHSPGVTPDGEPYEFIQRDIRINHVALVDNARAGAMARIFDNKPEAKIMATVTLDNGRAIEIDDSVAPLVADCIARLISDAKTNKDNADGLQAKLDTVTVDLDKAKAASSDDAIAALVKAVADTMDKAVKIGGEGFTCDSVDLITIKRAALTAKDSKLDLGDKSDAYIEAAFDMAFDRYQEEEEEDEDGKAAAKKAQDALAADLAKQTQDKDKPTPRQKFNDSLTNGYKKTLGEDS